MVKFLVNAGFTVVAVSDSKGGIHVPTGVNPELTLACKRKWVPGGLLLFGIRL